MPFQPVGVPTSRKFQLDLPIWGTMDLPVPALRMFGKLTAHVSHFTTRYLIKAQHIDPLRAALK